MMTQEQWIGEIEAETKQLRNFIESAKSRVLVTQGGTSK